MTYAVTVLGAGHAGVQAAAALREQGFDGDLTLVSGEPDLPYQRPPLSKSYLSGHEPDPLPLRARQFYDDLRIDLRLDAAVAAIDRPARRLICRDGGVGYDHLILATGARPRPLAALPPGTPGIYYLRTLADSRRIRAALADAAGIVVVGGGFLGLECASVAAAAGLRVTVLEAGPGLMGRSVSPAVASAVAALHARAGVEVLLGETIGAVEVTTGGLAGLRTRSGRFIPASAAVLCAGAVPNDELALAAGLSVGDGVLVDGSLTTSDPRVSAIGDCARWPAEGGRTQRLESVQNATDQARWLAARLAASAGGAGEARPGGAKTRVTEPDGAAYRALPWFWSEQGVGKLQIAGRRGPDDVAVVRGDPDSGRFSVFHFDPDSQRLTCVETVSRPADYLAGRKFLEVAGEAAGGPAGGGLSAAEAADEAIDLRRLARERAGQRIATR